MVCWYDDRCDDAGLYQRRCAMQCLLDQWEYKALRVRHTGMVYAFPLHECVVD